MLKIVGSIMVIAMCTTLGFEKSMELQKHLKELEELKRIFVILRSELVYSKVMFSEVFFKISKKTEGLYKEWLIDLAKKLELCGTGTFADIWKNSIRTYFDSTALIQSEKDELEQIGVSLQYVDAIDLYLAQLNFSIESTREELKRKKKLYQTIGVMSGIFLVIVLL